MKLQVPIYVLIVFFSLTAENKKITRKKQNYHTSEMEHHYQLFSTFTAYDTVRSNIFTQPECVPEALWAFMRHGTRYPHIKNMERYRILETLRDDILSNHYNGKGKLAKSQLKLLRKWRFIISNDEELHLTLSGYEELVNLGKRLKKTFPCLLDKKRFSSMHMKRTSAARTMESAAALTEGIFGESILLTNSTIDENLLKNGKNCSLWISSTNGDDSNNKIEQFKHSLEVQGLINNVNERLGFGNSLSFDTIADMYDVCGYEAAWYHGEYSTWCSAFSTEELQILEYLDDLSYYWKTGYGNPFTTKLGCELVRDMISKLNSSNELQKTTLYFAHSVGIRLLLTSLGIGRCCNPLSENIFSSSTDRNCWRTSHLSPFSANIISVLYSCKTSHEKKLKVGVYINEKIVKFPFCNGTLCDFEAFKNRFSSLIDQKNCNRDFCISSPTDIHES